MSLTAISSTSSVPVTTEPKPVSPPSSAAAQPSAPAPAADTVKISPAAQQASADVDHDGDSH